VATNHTRGFEQAFKMIGSSLQQFNKGTQPSSPGLEYLVLKQLMKVDAPWKVEVTKSHSFVSPPSGLR